MTISTSDSLLQRVRSPSDRAAWDRFVKLYTPLLFAWAHRLGLTQNDAADLVQDVFLVLLKQLPQFEYDENKSFRGWLWTVLRNRALQRKRRPQSVGLENVPELELSGSAIDAAEVVMEAEYREYLVARALKLMQDEFQPLTWKACLEYIVSGRSAAEVAAELGTTVEVVWAAKSRVLRRLRAELEGLLD